MRVERYREQAVLLRKDGKTYTEIAARIPVSKATLSQWLRDTPLPAAYFEKLALLKERAREKGWQARRQERIDRTAYIRAAAEKESVALMHDPLWLVGLTLYWAEGTKEKPWGRGTHIAFTNMDAETVLIFKRWCVRFLKIDPSDFLYSVYVHDLHKESSHEFSAWWAEALSIEQDRIRIYFKRSNATHVRHNDGDHYKGVFRLEVRKSVDLTRKISGWTRGMIHSLKSAEQ